MIALNEVQSRTGSALPIDYDDIAGGLPSRAQIAEIEPVVAALCLMRTSQQLLEHNVSTVGSQGDHGNRRRKPRGTSGYLERK